MTFAMGRPCHTELACQQASVRFEEVRSEVGRPPRGSVAAPGDTIPGPALSPTWAENRSGPRSEKRRSASGRHNSPLTDPAPRPPSVGPWEESSKRKMQPRGACTGRPAGQKTEPSRPATWSRNRESGERDASSRGRPSRRSGPATRARPHPPQRQSQRAISCSSTGIPFKMAWPLRRPSAGGRPDVEPCHRERGE
jgi:hypothetical protein